MGCRPECVANTDCPRNKACINNKCVNPCPGTCGLNAECTVNMHTPTCSCLVGYTGNPLQACHPVPESKTFHYKLTHFINSNILISPVVPTVLPIPEPCNPSPCGPYSVCKVINQHAVCSCQANYIGAPPACRPECMVSADCPQDKACISTKCEDPCSGVCGLNARCHVVNHNPICSCPIGFNGDPFIRCLVESKRCLFTYNNCLSLYMIFSLVF